MSRSAIYSALMQFVAATAGRNMTKAAYLAVAIGVATMVMLTVDPAHEAALGRRHVVDVPGVFRLRMGGPASRSLKTGRALSGHRPRPPGYRRRLAVPIALVAGTEPKTAWLFAVLWFVKVIPGIPGLRQLSRVLVLESGPLLSVLVLFLMVLFLGSVAEYFLERDVQPATFGNVPAALWWAVVTLDHHRLWRRGADHAARAVCRSAWS